MPTHVPRAEVPRADGYSKARARPARDAKHWSRAHPHPRGGRSILKRTPRCGSAVAAGRPPRRLVGGVRQGAATGDAGCARAGRTAKRARAGAIDAKTERGSRSHEADRPRVIISADASSEGGKAMAVAPRSSQKGANNGAAWAAQAGRVSVHVVSTTLTTRATRSALGRVTIEGGTLDRLRPAEQALRRRHVARRVNVII